MASYEVADVDNKSSMDHLQFQDITHSHSVSEEATPTKDNVQTHTFNNFPDNDDSDDDKADLLKGPKKSASFWTFEYYQNFFDVDTQQVMGRILGSMYPNPKRSYLQETIRPNPDLYGPFWICTTLVFTTAIAGNLANYIQHSGDYQWAYDFHKVTFAASAIFSYWWLMPTIFYCLLIWRGNPTGITFLELVCVYGYSLAIYIPISVFWVVQLNWLQWLLVMLGMTLSGSVLLLTFWPLVKHDDKKVALSTMSLVLMFHGLLAVGFVLYFFHVPDVHNTSIISVPSSLNNTLPEHVIT